jgi:hypothetical protein
MPRQKLGDEASIDVVAAAGAVADQHAHGLAAVKVRHRLRLSGRGRREHRRRDSECDERCSCSQRIYSSRLSAHLFELAATNNNEPGQARTSPAMT